jgi:hypothetical protein
MSQKKQDHSNQYYISQFENKYTQSSKLHIITIINTLIIHNDIYGFGIYFKRDRKEFTIVLKLKDVKGKNWIQMTYKLTDDNEFKRMVKKGGLGPKELYNSLLSDGYTFNELAPIQIANSSEISSISNPLSNSLDVEYNLAKFNKFDGGKNISRRRMIRRLRKSKKYI